MSALKIVYNSDQLCDVSVCTNPDNGSDTVIVLVPEGVDPQKEVDISSTDEDDDCNPAWLGADGELTKLSDMKDCSIRGLYRKFKKNNLQEVFSGWWDAIETEANDRGLDCC
jgi:hypothetical protein